MKNQKRLLSGLGIQNFKSFKEYSYIPLNDLSFFIGPNGSGKSSCWQMLQILQHLLWIDDYSIGDEERHKGAFNRFDLKEFPDYGTNAGDLLFSEKKPMIFELYSKVQLENILLNDFQVIFSFELFASANALILKQFNLMTIERDLLFGYEFDTINNETNSKPEIGAYFGQLLLDMAFQYNSRGVKSPNRNINRLFREKEDFDKIEDILKKVSEGFYEFYQYDVQLLLRVSNMKSPFSMLFPYEIEFFKENLSLSYDDDYLNRIVKLRNEFPYLHEILNFSYNGLKNTFAEVYKEISEIFFIDRRLIGFPEKSISMDSNSGKQLIDFKMAYNNWQQQDGKKRLIDFSKELLFKTEPIISIDHDNNNIKLLLGDRYLRNTGSGFWSLTFIMYGIIYCLVQNKPILVIEEPESHLHPNLQAILADFLINIVVNYKLTIVLETHSEYLTRRCQIRVFQYHNRQLTDDPVEEVKSMYDFNNFSSTKISKDSVTINSFEIEENGDKVVSKCIPLELKEDGQLEPGYPPSFASQSNQDAWLLMKIRNSSN